MTNEEKVGGTNIKAGVGLDRAKRGEADMANIKAKDKANGKTVSSTDNSIDGSNNIIPKYAKLRIFVFTALSVADCINNCHLAIF